MKYNPETERMFITPEGTVTQPIPAAILMIKFIEPTDAEMEKGQPFEGRIARARELAQATGFPIDVPVDVWGWGATNTHKLRKLYGYTTTPDLTGSVRIVVA